MKKIIVVCGPTATGKSDYAVELAKKLAGLNHADSVVGRTSQSEVLGEIISADSRQVYRGMDIGSGKITSEEMQGIPHHLLDVADPKEVFSVTQYQSLATQAIEDIIARGHTPIITGGTGLYIDAIVCGTIFPAVPPNKELREELQKLSLEELSQKLEILDPRRFALVDQKNKVRLIRAIEIATALGSVPETIQNPQYDVEWHYRDFPDEVLKERIHIRLFARIRDGMIEEVQRLHNEGVSWERLESLGLEYRYLALYLQNKLDKETMLKELEMAIWHYAKRQRTWFKKYAK
jgi:tRNA dimethylallyltransferase